MQNDPDIPAMSNRPVMDEDDAMLDDEAMQTTVIEGGPAGGLFLPDHDDTSDSDIDKAREMAEDRMDQDERPEGWLGEQPMQDVRSDEESDQSDEVAEDGDKQDLDPVVTTHNIYATKRLSDHLYLFQYPIRPPNRQYIDQERPSEARIKPRANMIEIDVPIPESNYYDQRRGRQWTDEALRTQTIAGRISQSRNYLVGVMDKGHLHVTPIKGIAQLRPNFKYIDERDAEEKETKRSENAAERAPRAAKAIQVSAKSSDAMPDLSTTSLLRAAEEENWVKLGWRDQYNNESSSVSQWLITKKTDTVCESTTDKAAYLNLLSTINTELPKPGKVKKQE